MQTLLHTLTPLLLKKFETNQRDLSNILEFVTRRDVLFPAVEALYLSRSTRSVVECTVSECIHIIGLFEVKPIVMKRIHSVGVMFPWTTEMFAFFQVTHRVLESIPSCMRYFSYIDEIDRLSNRKTHWCLRVQSLYMSDIFTLYVQEKRRARAETTCMEVIHTIKLFAEHLFVARTYWHRSPDMIRK